MDLQGLRVLEVGCGVGLPSLLLNHIGVDITATDYHPEAQGYLNINSELNNDDKITFMRSPWSDLTNTEGLFDIIIGSDLLYEDEHITQLSDYMLLHLKPVSKVILVDPGRGRYTKFIKIMREHGFTSCIKKPLQEQLRDPSFHGYIITLKRTKPKA